MTDLNSSSFELAAKTVAMLAVDAVEKAKSGHPGMPMGAADYGILLWLKHLKFNPKDPQWLNRDRFVLSNGHGSMFLYAMLHLSGYDLTLEDLKNFRQWESKTPGHPESTMTPGVECTTGPLGQGVSNAVGMALGQEVLAARYNTNEHSIIDHSIYCFVGDGCLMEGISSEASSLAGHLGLGNLLVIFDDNHISIAGDTKLAFTEDVAKRYQAYGWQVQHIDGHNFEEIDRAIIAAKNETQKPSLILARTTIGKGSPNKANTAGVHGSPLGPDETKLTKAALNWPTDQTFVVPDEVRQLFATRRRELETAYTEWKTRYATWRGKNSELATELETRIAQKLPATLKERLLAAAPENGKAAATRKLSAAVLQAAAAELPALIGGSADLEPSTLTVIKDSSSITRESFTGRNIHFGVREHVMGALMNGLSYYGGFIPFGSTFLCFYDYMKPAVRLAALSHLQSLFIFTHDSVFLGEDGPTHQPIEHLQALRVVPNLHVFRPADGIETAMSYYAALSRTNGPSALCFSRQDVEPISRPKNFKPEDVLRGGYTVYDSAPGSTPALVVVATGSELPLAVTAAKEVENNFSVRVVSMPCVELFQEQDKQYRQALIPPQAKKVVVEAGTPFGWCDMIEASPADTLVIGIKTFGVSAPYEVLLEKFGFTPAAVVQKIKTRFL